jgi:ATP-binding cassette subfamily F protein 3
LILLDEPTNHLDFDTVEALTEALRNYPGTVVVVSHDRSFIGRISTKILEIRDGRAEIYPGTYDDYLWSLEKGSLKNRFAEGVSVPAKAAVKSVAQAPVKLTTWEENKKLKDEIKSLSRQIKKNEDGLEKLSAQLTKLNEELLVSQGPRTGEIAKELGSCAQKIQELEETLLEQMEKLAAAEARAGFV